jgi:hypothetical protein
MDRNVCGRGPTELVGLGYENGDAYEMYRCPDCRERFVSEETVESVEPLQTP